MKASSYNIEKITTYGLEQYLLTIVTVEHEIVVKTAMSREGAMTIWLNHLRKYN